MISFTEKFKKLSELRISISIIATLSFFPFMNIILCNMAYYAISDANKISLIHPESLRQSILNINYIFMYIDQILLKCYIKSNKAVRSNTVRKMNTKLGNDDPKGLRIFPTQTNSYSRLETPTTPSSVATFSFNGTDALYKRNGNYNNGSCESLDSLDNKTDVTLEINDNPDKINEYNNDNYGNNNNYRSSLYKINESNITNDMHINNEINSINEINTNINTNVCNNINSNNEINININNDNNNNDNSYHNNINNTYSNDGARNDTTIQFNSSSIMTPIEDISFEEDSSITKNIFK